MHTVTVDNVFKQLTSERINEMIADGFEIVHAKNCKGCK
jgi:hypothetical protein